MDEEFKVKVVVQKENSKPAAVSIHWPSTSNFNRNYIIRTFSVAGKEAIKI